MKSEHQSRSAQPVRVYETPSFRTLVECCPGFVAVLDDEGVVQYVSAAITPVSGYAPGEVIGKKLVDFVHPEDQAFAQRNLLTKTAELVRATYRYRHKDGSWRHIETLTRNALQDPDISGIIVNTRDVTDQLRAEESLRKVSRALNAFSAVSAALVDARDEIDLLGQVCRIMVESVGYRMAWVGYADRADQNVVRPVAQFGYESGYLAGANIAWDESERGRGPTGTAIRKGTSQVNQRTLTNPLMQPWWQDAMKRGFASSVAIPLKDDQGAFGALTIYAPEADAFDREELKLLEQLVAELSYGIIALRARDELARGTAA